jgi:hypothetical protein
MAKRISELRTTNKGGNTSREYVLLSNIDSNSSTKIALNDIFPTLQSGKINSGVITEGALGTVAQELFVGGGVGSGTANTDKSILIFKGIATSNVLTSGLTGTRALQLRTDKATADGTKQNVVVNLNQSLLDLSEADNTTSEFLSESGGSNPFNYTTSNVLGTLGVASGGTGASTFAQGGLLYGNTAGAIQALTAPIKGTLFVGSSASNPPTTLAVGTNDLVLTADSTQASGLKWAKPTISSATFTSNLTMNNNNLILGSGYITGTGSSAGISLSSSSDYVYIGAGTKFFDQRLTVEGGLSLGQSTGSSSQTIQQVACTSGASPTMYIKGSDNLNDNAGGALDVTAGSGQLNGNGGELILSGGASAGTGTAGSVTLKTNNTNGLVVNATQDVSIPNGQLQLEQAEPIGVRGTTSVIQATSLTTGVTLNSSAGIITLHTTALGGHDSVYFTLTNSVINVRSIIMLTTEVSNAEAAGAGLVAQVADRAAGSCKIRISNTGNASTTTDHSVHFFIVNEIV